MATDGSPNAKQAVDFAVDLAQKYGSRLTILAVAPLIPVYVSSTEPWVPTEVSAEETAHYRKIVGEAVSLAQGAGVAEVTGVTLEGVIVDEIIGQLEKQPADLLVLGSRGLSAAKRLLLGSVSDAVTHHVACPVLVVRSHS